MAHHLVPGDHVQIRAEAIASLKEGPLKNVLIKHPELIIEVRDVQFWGANRHGEEMVAVFAPAIYSLGVPVDALTYIA